MNVVFFTTDTSLRDLFSEKVWDAIEKTYKGIITHSPEVLEQSLVDADRAVVFIEYDTDIELAETLAESLAGSPQLKRIFIYSNLTVAEVKKHQKGKNSVEGYIKKPLTEAILCAVIADFDIPVEYDQEETASTLAAESDTDMTFSDEKEELESSALEEKPLENFVDRDLDAAFLSIKSSGEEVLSGIVPEEDLKDSPQPQEDDLLNQSSEIFLDEQIPDITEEKSSESENTTECLPENDVFVFETISPDEMEIENNARAVERNQNNELEIEPLQESIEAPFDEQVLDTEVGDIEKFEITDSDHDEGEFLDFSGEPVVANGSSDAESEDLFFSENESVISPFSANNNQELEATQFIEPSGLLNPQDEEYPDKKESPNSTESHSESLFVETSSNDNSVSKNKKFKDDLLENSFVGSNQGDLGRFQSILRSLREERSSLVLEMDRLQKELILKIQENTTLRGEIEDLKIENVITKKRRVEEVDDLKHQLRLNEDKMSVIKEKYLVLSKALESEKHRATIDTDQIKKREKELESKLELILSDHEAQIERREQKILDLRRKIDSLEFNTQNLIAKEQKHKEEKMLLEERLSELNRALRGSIKMLEDDVGADEEFLTKIDKI